MALQFKLQQAETPRCPACQLQLCKSRNMPPHAALQVSENTVNGARTALGRQDAQYLCKTCGSILLNSVDMAKPGWRKQR